MSLRIPIHWSLVGCVLMACSCLCHLRAGTGPWEELEADFLAPRPEHRPWVHWFWVDGNISKQGITSDLEAMRSAGLGGLVLMDVTQQVPTGSVQFGSAAWYDLFAHAVSEAYRLGLEFSAHNSPGWSGSGGPWIEPRHGMQRIVWGATNVMGPGRVRLQLPRLPAHLGNSWDVAVLAFPAVVGDGVPLPGARPQVTGNFQATQPLSTLVDGSRKTFVRFPSTTRSGGHDLTVRFAEPILAEQIQITARDHEVVHLSGELEAMDNRGRFRFVRDIVLRGNQGDFQFLPVETKSFRLVIRSMPAAKAPLELAEIMITPVYRMPSYQAKAGMARGEVQQGPARIPPHGCIDRAQVRNLSDLVQDGEIEWEVPPGLWTLMRFGHMPTGRMNPPAREGGLGLECDKLSKEAVRLHFRELLNRLRDRAEPARFAHAHIDSWEVGFQNWTPGFHEEFRRLRGYDPRPYLPAFAGKYIENAELTERFLWDVRRTIADLQAENYAAEMSRLAKANGMTLSAEAYGNGCFDDLLYASRVDVPMSEFWNETDEYHKFHTTKEMSSVAHVYGKPVTAAEAFTAWPWNARWQQHPRSLKLLGDTAFIYGANRLVLHRFVHQPFVTDPEGRDTSIAYSAFNLRPGITLGMWGLHYEGTQTWWGQARAWHEYLSRCQMLLRAGLFGADVCYLTGAGAFASAPTVDALVPALPERCAYDVAPPDAVLTRFTVSSNRIVTPDGTSYGALILSPSTEMTLALVSRLRDLVRGGATVVGPKPEKAPGLENYPECDEAVRKVSAELWGPCDGKNVTEHRFGSGRMVWGKPLATVLAEQGWQPAFRHGATQGKPVRAVHRVLLEGHLFFLSNPNPHPVEVAGDFGVFGLRPELWNPESGQVTQMARWELRDRRIRFPIHLEAHGSIFVVFRRSAQEYDAVTEIARNSKPDPTANVAYDKSGSLELRAKETGTYSIKLASGRTLSAQVELPFSRQELTGPWQVNFDTNGAGPGTVQFPQLQSWSAHTDPKIRYYSGPAIYRKQLLLNKAPAEVRTFLNLGKVEIIADVSVNGKEAGILWKEPYEVDISHHLTGGTNLLEVKVVNLWVNRMIGDEHLPEDCEWIPGDPGSGVGNALVAWPEWLVKGQQRVSGRVTFFTRRFYLKSYPLLPSGLLGPVTLRTEAVVSPR